jgi:tripartite ATP-independent transporter DctP family solute receptor
MKMVLAIATALIVTCGLATPLPQTEAQDRPIRLSHHHPVGSVLDITAQKFAEVVNKANAGITVQVFPAAQLGQEQENGEGVHYGTVDASINGSVFFNKWLRSIGFEFLPFLFKDEAHLDRTLTSDSAPVMLAVRKALAEKSNVYLLGYLDLGFRDFATRTKPITKLEDLKGLKMRAPEIWTWIRMYQLLGANPTPVTWGEVYTALQTGVADGYDASPMNMIDNKHYEVTKYLTKASVIETPMAFTINKKRLEGLTAAQQDVVRTAAKQALEHGNKESRALTRKAYAILKEKGMIYNEMNTAPVAQAVKPMYDEYISKNGGKEFIDLVISLRDK